MQGNQLRKSEEITFDGNFLMSNLQPLWITTIVQLWGKWGIPLISVCLVTEEHSKNMENIRQFITISCELDTIHIFDLNATHFQLLNART